MSERGEIVPDWSVNINLEGYDTSVLVSPRYDWIRSFPWLDFAVMNVITEQGVAQIFIDTATAERIVDTAKLPLVELDYITDTDYERYVEVESKNMDDSWLEGEGEHPLG